jgi:hypothetical protein
MALLRLRFPWGFLLTTTGYAALAAAAGWLLSTDLHGHLWLRCALHAAGGAALGGVAWRLSERLTDWVNLHTSPLPRLGLAGAAASVLATYATGPFCELAVGAGALWPEVVCPLLFFAAGLAPMVAVVTLVAGLETMLAARRGGGGAIEALRPIWRHLVVGAALAAGSAYAAVELVDPIERLMVALAPERVRGSDWLAREQRLFRGVHALWSCEVLVVPFAAGTPSVDRAARSLITRYVAAELAERSGKCVADPTLVARALGSRRRAVAEADVEALAETIGARWVLRGTVERDAAQPALSVSLRLDQHIGPQQWSRGEQTQWGPLEFSDELPPEAAFARIVRDVADGLGLELEPVADAKAADAGGSVPLPTTAAELVAAADSPLARARALQLLAALHHPSDIDGEHLWERSLIALRALPTEDARARLLRARAALHLYRRPHAVALLHGLADPEAQALLAVSNGNLVLAEPLMRAVQDPAGALTLALEVEALRAAYGKTAGLPERRQALLDSHPGYAALLYAAMQGSAVDPGPALALIDKQLDADGIGVNLSRLRVLAARLGLALGEPSAALAAAIEHGREVAWQTQAVVWRSQPAYDQPAPWDAADALYGAARGAVIAAARNRAQAGQSTALMDEALALGRPYAGYPPLAGSVAVALQAELESAGPLQQARARRLPLDVLAWEEGESDTERVLRARIPEGLPAADADEPPRPWRAPEAASAPATQLARQQAYSHDSFDPLERAVNALERAGLNDQATRLREDARLRFIGSPARERFLVRRAEESGDLNAYASVLMERVREQPADWAAYLTLARVYLSARQPAYAQQVLLAYKGGGQGGAAEVQRAHEAGMLLLGAGEAELARPLLQRAAAGADSAAKLWSQIALARLDGNWAEAQARALQLHESHQAPGALAHAASVAFLVGDKDAGWRAFYEAAKRFEDFAPWGAALTGHRIERTRAADVEAFADRWKSLSGERATETRLKGYFLFNALLVDRAPAPDLVEALAALAEKRQDPQLQALIAGYAALRRGDHAAAAARLLPAYKAAARDSAPHLLPYLAIALSRANRAEEAQALLTQARDRAPRAFHTLLSAAWLAGAAGSTDHALRLLWEAFIALPAPDQHMVPAGYQLLEVAEQLYGLSGDDRYRALLVDLARRQQLVWPVSWAYTFDARYAPHSDAAEAALAVGLFLDPESAHLRDSGEDQRKRAIARFPTGNPFQRG